MTMPDSPDTRQMERAADDARARVRNDIAALGDEVRADRAAAQSRLHDNAAAGAAWFYMRQRP